MKLNDTIPEWLTAGIFESISDVSGFTPPWNLTANQLDMQYHGNHSGDKKASPLVEKLLDSELHLTSENLGKLASLIVGMYSTPWMKLYDTLELTYNPIHNYDMTESENGAETNTGTIEDVGAIAHGETVNNVIDETNTDITTHGEIVANVTDETNVDTTAHGEIIGTVTTVSATQDTNKYGFNTVTAVPVEADSGANNGTGTETHSGTTEVSTDHDNTLTETHSGTTEVSTDHDNHITETHGGTTGNNNIRTNNLEKTSSNSHTRAGNIGVMTTQNMIKQERDIWKWKYFDVVFSDVDAVLTCPIYESEE